MPLNIPYIPSSNDIPAEAAHINISSNNWAAHFPYAPHAEAFLWHSGQFLHIVYRIDEEYVAGVVEADNGKVFTDSCAEFFIAFDNNGYYNIEANCTGKILMSHRRARKVDVNYLTPVLLSQIKRTPSLGSATFNCRKANGPWELRLDIPVNVFFKHNITDLRGVEANANVYKCGDNLPQPHYLSWSPINTPEPNFHCPDFFAPVRFMA